MPLPLGWCRRGGEEPPPVRPPVELRVGDPAPPVYLYCCVCCWWRCRFDAGLPLRDLGLPPLPLPDDPAEAAALWTVTSPTAALLRWEERRRLTLTPATRAPTSTTIDTTMAAMTPLLSIAAAVGVEGWGDGCTTPPTMLTAAMDTRPTSAAAAVALGGGGVLDSPAVVREEAHSRPRAPRSAAMAS